MLNIIRRQFGYTAYTWGSSKLTGHSTPATKSNPIQPIESLRGKIAKIAIGSKHAAAVTDDGKLFTWGDKNYGKLGLPASYPDYVATPTEVPFFSKNNIKIKDVVVGPNHTIVLDTDGKVYSYGKGRFTGKSIGGVLFPEFVALGHPVAEDIYKPKQIERLADTPIEQVATGNHFSTALTKDGRLMVWGRGEFGVLGCGNKQVAEPISNVVFEKMCEGTGLKIVKVQSFSDFTSVLMSDGLIYSFGNNDEGQMGLGKSMGMEICEIINIPTAIEFENDPEERVADFDLGMTSACVLGTSGRVYQMGQRLHFNPALLQLDYEHHKVRSIAAFAKGAGLVTENNEIFTRGKFWPIQAEIDDDINTAVCKINFGNRFDGQHIVEIGNKFGEIGHVLVDESKAGSH